MTLSKETLLKAVLLGSMAVPMLAVSAVCQQEVDPTYYDPWAAQPKVVAQAQAKTTEKSKVRKSNTTATAAHPKVKKQTRTADAGQSNRTETIASASSPR